MRKVNVRTLQRNFYTEIKDIPFIVTRKRQNICVVMPFRDDLLIPDEKVEIPKKVKDEPLAEIEQSEEESLPPILSTDKKNLEVDTTEITGGWTQSLYTKFFGRK